MDSNPNVTGFSYTLYLNVNLVPSCTNGTGAYLLRLTSFFGADGTAASVVIIVWSLAEAYVHVRIAVTVQCKANLLSFLDIKAAIVFPLARSDGDVFVDVLDGLSEDIGNTDARSVIKSLYVAARLELVE